MPETNHVTEIDKLIPKARKEASRLVEEEGVAFETRQRGVGKGKHGRYDSYVSYKHSFYTQFFHAAMNRMTKERGLRR